MWFVAAIDEIYFGAWDITPNESFGTLHVSNNKSCREFWEGTS